MKNSTAFALLIFTFFFVSITYSATFDWATVGNPGNSGELSGEVSGTLDLEGIVGGVDYTYRISKHEVTSGQYTEFLNAVAASDPNGLYNISSNRPPDPYGTIVRTGTDGSYTYSVSPSSENRPAIRVSFLDAMRFVNWLENGQPIGAQGPSTTENGVYAISDGWSEVRNANATFRELH